MSWRKITCEESDALKSSRDLEIIRGRTDMDGECGDPEIYREWGDKVTGQPLLRDHRFPHPREIERTYLRRYGHAPARKPCEHYAFEDGSW